MLRGVPSSSILLLCAAVGGLTACEPTAPPFRSDPVPVRNACGGWGPEALFRADLGDTCGECGRGQLVCQGDSDLVCVGDWTNECGGCQELDVQIDASCGVCDGSWTCSADGNGAICVGGEANVCGGCVELDAAPGDACGACGDGKWLCDPDQGTLVCDEPPRNACGGCTDLVGTPGVACGVCGAGTLVCASDRESLTCAQDEVELNACGGCVALNVEVGGACGSCGTWICTGINGVACQENTARLCGYLDADGDGWGVEEAACSCDGSGVARAYGDCDDSAPTNHPVCGNGVIECGDEEACQFEPDARQAAVLSPIGGVDPSPGARAPISADVDVSGDGIDDLIIAMPSATCGTSDDECGSVLVVAGPLHQTKITRPLARPLDEGTTFGTCVAAGDFDGDGANDVAITGMRGQEAEAHFFMGPIADLRLLQPDSADYVVSALRTMPVGGELVTCHAARGADGRSSLLLSFDAAPHVQIVEYDGLVDDVEWYRGTRRRHVTDIVADEEGDLVYVVSTGVDQIDVEVWRDIAPFSRPTFVGVRTVHVGDDPGFLRAQNIQMDEGTGLLVSAPDIGVGVYTEDNPGWPILPDLTMLGLRVLPASGWPIAGGFDLDGDGQLEFAVGNPHVSPTGEVMWSPLWEHFVGWRPTIYPSDMTTFTVSDEHSGFGIWLDGSGDLNADGEVDLVVLESGGQDDMPQMSIFFARRGY